jgi:hypothetical protein
MASDTLCHAMRHSPSLLEEWEAEGTHYFGSVTASRTVNASSYRLKGQMM